MSWRAIQADLLFFRDIFVLSPQLLSLPFYSISQKKLTLFDFSSALGYSTKPVCGLLFSL